MYQPSNLILPHGPVTEWNMELISSEVLSHEYELCNQVLYGKSSGIDSPWILPGLYSMLENNFNNLNNNNQIADAIVTWKERLRRAENELERRFLLS